MEEAEDDGEDPDRGHEGDGEREPGEELVPDPGERGLPAGGSRARDRAGLAGVASAARGATEFIGGPVAFVKVWLRR